MFRIFTFDVKALNDGIICNPYLSYQDDGSIHTTTRGTPKYVAPEIYCILTSTTYYFALLNLPL